MEEVEETKEHMDSQSKKSHDDKSRLSWVVLVAAFIIQIVFAVQYHVMSVLITEIQETFNVTFTELGTMAAIRGGMIEFAGVIIAPFVPWTGCRVMVMCALITCAIGSLASAFVNSFPALILTLAIISALGSGSIFIPCNVMIQQHFTKHRALAVSLGSSGLSLGSMVATPLIRLLVNHYGWRGGLILLGGIMLQMLVPAMMFVPPKKQWEMELEKMVQGFQMGPNEKEKYLDSKIEQAKMEPPKDAYEGNTLISPTLQMNEGNSQTPQNSKTSFFHKVSVTLGLSLLSIKPFLVFTIASLPIDIGIFTYMTLGISRAIHLGVDVTKAAFINTCLGVASFTGRVLAGAITNHKCTHRVIFYGAMGIITGGSIMLSVVVGSHLAPHLVCMAIFGLFFGQLGASFPTVVTDSVGVKNTSRALGLVQLMHGVAAIISLPLAGWLYDVTDSYTWPFLVMGSMTVLGGMLILFVMLPLTGCGQQRTDT